VFLEIGESPKACTANDFFPALSELQRPESQV
jgi:hypothetical protein